MPFIPRDFETDLCIGYSTKSKEIIVAFVRVQRLTGRSAQRP